MTNFKIDQDEFPEETYFSENPPDNSPDTPPPLRVNVDVVLTPEDKKIHVEHIPVIVNSNGDIFLKDLVEKLRRLHHLQIDASEICYYSRSTDLFVNCGKYPLPNYSLMPHHEITRFNNKLTINLRFKQSQQFRQQQQQQNHQIAFISTPTFNEYGKEGIFKLQNLEGMNNGDHRNAEAEKRQYDDKDRDRDRDRSEDDDSLSYDGEDGNKRKTRHKERRIGEAIELVLAWRKLYYGVTDISTGEYMKMNLEEAAKRVGVAKKSLDDYLLMIKHAKNFGFDFQGHHGDRFGVLRTFVKERKNFAKTGAAENDDDDEKKKIAKCKGTKKIKRDK